MKSTIRLLILGLASAALALQPSCHAAPVTESITINTSSGNVVNTPAINFASSKLKLNGATLEATFASKAANQTFTGANTFTQGIHCDGPLGLNLAESGGGRITIITDDNQADDSILVFKIPTSSGSSSATVDFGTQGGGIVAYTNIGQTLTLKNLSTGTSVSASIAWSDGIKQTFNPNGTNAGINVGAQSGKPSTLVDGDLGYDAGANELWARINGATVALGVGAAGALTGTTLASNVVTSSLTGVGTLTSGGTGSGFTLALGTSTLTGSLPAAQMPALTGDVTTSAGAVATTIANNAVTSAKINDGSIVNADINSSAAIDATKISGTAATLSANQTFTGNLVFNTSTNPIHVVTGIAGNRQSDVQIDNHVCYMTSYATVNQAIAGFSAVMNSTTDGSVTMDWADATGNYAEVSASNDGIWLRSTNSAYPVVVGGGTSVSDWRLLEASGNGSNYTGFKAPASLSANTIYEMPAADGSAGDVLKTNGSKVLSWVAPSGGGGSTNWLRKTANYTASNGEKIEADANGGDFDITLPSSPATGDFNIVRNASGGTVLVKDGGGTPITTVSAASLATFIYTGSAWLPQACPDKTTVAPIDSPNFTGNATATTQADGDNSTKLATTAFVKLGNALSNSGITPYAPGGGTYHFYNDGTSGNVISITINQGVVTDIVVAP
jgi:hypothetical protein